MSGIALSGARIFTGEYFLDGHAVLLDGLKINGIVEAGAVPSRYDVETLSGGLLAPGYIDVQVNGGGGVLLNDQPNADGVRAIAKAHRAHGTTGMLPTVITDTSDVIADAIEAVRKVRNLPGSGVLGIHVEGPFLDPARKGAHDAKLIRPLTDLDIKFFGRHDSGRLMLTVAPNKVTPAQIRDLAAYGIRVSLGHSDATHKEVQAALAAGATAFTHLYNAMSQFTGREPGMVGAALSDRDSFIGVIADGHHVHDMAMNFAFQVADLNRFMLISDAMPPAAGGPDVFHLQGRRVVRKDGKLVLDDGTLAGSNLTMDEAVRYCVNTLNVPLAAALRMASLNPAKFLGLDQKLGRIASGALASLVHLDADLHVQKTWVDGQ